MLLNTDYKIITKVLVNRVKPVMPTIIHPDQCCSVPGRSSEDNATLVRDVCDYLEVNERMACAFISIDQEKAFDYVGWDFLDRILGTMNFGPQFRSYIKSIYHDIRSACYNIQWLCFRVFSRATRCTTRVSAISIVVCHGGTSVWTSDTKVPRNTGIVCAVCLEGRK